MFGVILNADVPAFVEGEKSGSFAALRMTDHKGRNEVGPYPGSCPDYPEVAHPMPGSVVGDQGYNDVVRHYTTEPMNGGITFKCVSCQHSVSTLDFDAAKGNRRTQAAQAMNQHSAESHSAATRPSSPAYADGHNRF